MSLTRIVSLKLFLILYLCFLITCTFTPAAWSAPGDLDTSFGTGGIVTTPIGSGEDFGNSVAVQSDGKIVVAGYTRYTYSGTDEDFIVVRYNSDGSLDTSFGIGGIVLTPIGNLGDRGSSLVIQSDGKIVVAGWSNNGSNDDFAVIRYNSDGSRDTTFGTDGIVTTPIGSLIDEGRAVALQSDGKIVVAGFASMVGNYDFAVVRYNTDGSLDTTFDTDGIVTTPIIGMDEGFSITIQTDGKILVSGKAHNGTDDDFAVVRYNTDGSLDTTFDTDGIVTTDYGSEDNGRSMAVQPDGKIVVAGESNDDFAVLRYNSDGSLDTTFDADGIVITPIGSLGDGGRSAALQSDGKIVVAGWSSDGTNGDIVVVRYNNDGSLDTTFDTDGIVTTSLGGNDMGNSVVLQPDGKIVVAGFSHNGTDYDFTVVRYHGIDNMMSVIKDGDGTGTVTSSPAGIDCGNDCSEVFPAGTEVTLTAKPDEGDALLSWTGADCPGNYTCIVTVDQNYTITATFHPDDDGDGVSSIMENGGPNSGDGNRDGVPDLQQAGVTTLKNINEDYVTMVSAEGTALDQVTARINPSPGNSPSNVVFSEGFFSFINKGIAPGGSAVVDLILHQRAVTFSTVYKYGPTSDNTSDHWYDFLYNNGTGAEFGVKDGSTVIKFHFKDGGRGDGDLKADGIIVDPSGPGNEGTGAGIGGGGGGGGCFLLNAN